MTTAFIFPGQGSQVVGMGRELYEVSDAARAIFERADRTLDLPLTRFCFEGPEEQLTATENAQPALLTVCTALLAAMHEHQGYSSIALSSDAAAFVAGHSLGEYSALVAAGALEYTTALRLVRRRGELMAAATEGTMAAILGSDEQSIEAACREASQGDELVVVANYNAPGQLVISGAAAAVERAGNLAKQAGAKRIVPLKVSAAFHSPLLQSAADALRSDLSSAGITDAHIPMLANVTAEPLTAAAAIEAELATQVTAPVRWIASVQRMAESGVDRFIEVGPGNVLTGLIKRISPGATLVNISDIAGVRGFVGGGR